jgi:hypothetical protein
MAASLSKRWLDGPVPEVSGTMTVISLFLREETIADWTAFTLQDAQAALEELVHYTAYENVWDVMEDDNDTTSPNLDNDWHQVLHGYEMNAALADLPGECPPDIPFY